MTALTAAESLMMVLLKLATLKCCEVFYVFYHVKSSQRAGAMPYVIVHPL